MKQAIYFTNFTANEVFDNAKLNVFCNQLYTLLINSTSLNLLQNYFCVDGAVALLLQEVSVPSVNKVQFSTNSQILFNLLKSNISALAIKYLVKNESELSFKVENTLIQIQYLTIAKIDLVNVDGVFVRTIKEIKI